MNKRFPLFVALFALVALFLGVMVNGCSEGDNTRADVSSDQKTKHDVKLIDNSSADPKPVLGTDAVQVEFTVGTEKHSEPVKADGVFFNGAEGTKLMINSVVWTKDGEDIQAKTFTAEVTVGADESQNTVEVSAWGHGNGLMTLGANESLVTIVFDEDVHQPNFDDGEYLEVSYNIAGYRLERTIVWDADEYTFYRDAPYQQLDIQDIELFTSEGSTKSEFAPGYIDLQPGNHEVMIEGWHHIY